MRQPAATAHTRRFPAFLLPLVAIGLALATSGASCLWPWQPPEDTKARTAGLRAFGSAEELRQFLVEQANARYTDNRTNNWWFFLAPPTMAQSDSRAESNGTAGGDAGGGTQFSTTTTQEQGVDESDVIKNNGEYIYWLQSTKIHVVKAVPPDAMTEVATITLDTAATSIYLRGNQLVAISPQWSYGIYDTVWGNSSGGGSGSGWAESGTATVAVNSSSTPVADDVAQTTSLIYPPWGGSSNTIVTTFDVSTPANPVKQVTLTFQGNLAESRVIDNRLYLVTTMWPELPNQPTPATLNAIPLEDWLPKYQVVGGDGDTRTGNTTPWNGFYRPVDGDGYQITTIVTVDLDNPTAEFESTAITANAGVIYASLNALYVTDTTSDWTLNTSREDTMIHKMAFTDAGTEYVASGLVPGRPLNQYSLGEYSDHLRIATTLESWSQTGSASASGVYVLGVDGMDLKVVGKVEDLGIGETIYAVRFMGTRGFVVTFKRIDPLYAMDLSDPTNPKVVGELKIPGYSDFMLPIGDNHLLAIGKDAQEAGDWGAWVQGVQLSIFDVSDMANPRRVQNKVIGGRGTNSEANYNPKAFNYFAAKNAVAFPIDLYTAGTRGPEWGQLQFTGVMVFDVSIQNGFTELGRISTVPDTQPDGGCWWMYSGSGRGVFIGDNVYAVSDIGVKAAALDDMSIILGTLDFAGDAAKESCYWIEPMILPEGGGGLR